MIRRQKQSLEVVNCGIADCKIRFTMLEKHEAELITAAYESVSEQEEFIREIQSVFLKYNVPEQWISQVDLVLDACNFFKYLEREHITDPKIFLLALEKLNAALFTLIPRLFATKEAADAKEYRTIICTGIDRFEKALKVRDILEEKMHSLEAKKIKIQQDTERVYEMIVSLSSVVQSVLEKAEEGTETQTNRPAYSTTP